MTNFVYRSGSAADGEALLTIHRRAILETAVAGYDSATAISWAHGLTAEQYGHAMAEGEQFEIASLSRGHAVGFCSIRGNIIVALYVDPAYARQGVGCRLLDRAKRHIAASGSPTARLRASLGAVPFYRKRGFAAVGEHLWQSRGGIEIRVLVMECNLPPCPIASFGMHQA